MIQKLFQKIKKSTFVKDNIILFVGSFLAGILGFFYHFYMGRVLGVEDYGILGTILAGFYLYSASVVNTLQTSFTKFTSNFLATKDLGKIKHLIFRSTKFLLVVSVLMSVAYLIFLPYFSDFLHIEQRILLISLGVFFFSLFIPIGRGVLQGLQDFKSLSLNYFVEGLAKILLGILAIYLGYQLAGAIVALIITYILTICFFTFQLYKRFKPVTATKFSTRHIYIYSFPVFCMITTLTLLFSLDVVLVKHFFTETQAGYYSALSLLGKIIFFGTLSISQVMFPKVSAQHAAGKQSLKTFMYSLLIVLFCILCALAVYFLFPELLVTILFGADFLPIAPLVGFFGLFIGLISILYLVSFYLISLNKTKFIFLLVIGNILQAVLIYQFHTSLMQVVLILISLVAVLLFLLLALHFRLFFPFGKKHLKTAS